MLYIAPFSASSTHTLGGDLNQAGQMIGLKTAPSQEWDRSVTLDLVATDLYEIHVVAPAPNGDSLCWGPSGTSPAQLEPDFSFVGQSIKIRECTSLRAVEPKALQWRLVSVGGNSFILESPHFNGKCVATDAIETDSKLKFRAAGGCTDDATRFVVVCPHPPSAPPSTPPPLSPPPSPPPPSPPPPTSPPPLPLLPPPHPPITPQYGYSFGPDGKGHSEAEAYCSGLGGTGRIAQPRNAQENAAIQAQFLGKENVGNFVWLGLKRPASSPHTGATGWTYSNGVPLEAHMYQNWASSAFTANFMGDACVTMFIDTGEWRSFACTVLLHWSCEGVAPPPSPPPTPPPSPPPSPPPVPPTTQCTAEMVANAPTVTEAECYAWRDEIYPEVPILTNCAHDPSSCGLCFHTGGYDMDGVTEAPVHVHYSAKVLAQFFCDNGKARCYCKPSPPTPPPP